MSRKRKWNSRTAQVVCQATSQNDPVAGAITLAERLTMRCGLTHPAFHLPQLASWQAAMIEECEMDDAGRLIPLPFGEFSYLIQVNASHPIPKKNFSICHEIGHTLMPDYAEDPQPRQDLETMLWYEESEEEFLCDIAASELLMPRREFVPRLRGCGLKIESLTELASEFGASLEATALNIVRAELNDIAVIVWELGWNKRQAQEAAMPSLFGEEDGLGPPPKSYRIQLAAASGQMQNYHFPHNKSIGDDSLIRQAAETQLSVSGMQSLPVGGDQFHDFYTQSISFPIRRYGALERRVFTLVHLQEPDESK